MDDILKLNHLIHLLVSYCAKNAIFSGSLKCIAAVTIVKTQQKKQESKILTPELYIFG